MLPFKLVYTDDFNLNLGAHVFPAVKYQMIHARLLEDGLADADDFLEPQPVSDDDLHRVHTREWIRKLKAGKLDPWEVMRLEVPYSPQLVRAFWLSAGGAILASQRALADGCGVNLGGGFHHAFPDHGEGFCAINDVAVAIRRLQSDGALRTAMVVDLDVHHGNGTAAIFAADPSVFTLSMHQENNYPHPKPPSDLDVGLDDFTGDDAYLRLLRQALDTAFTKFAQDAPKRAITPPPEAPAAKDTSTEKPDLLWYLAGADPYKEDQLGGLALTLDGLVERDRIVIRAARDRGIPLAITFAGGYAVQVTDTVHIHTNTIRAARDAFKTRNHG